MKNKSTLLVATGILTAFAAGIILGLALTNPGLSVTETVATIGRVDKYRNVRITEQDIELRNELLADPSLKESYKNHLLYEYAANVKLADDIRFALEAAGRAGAFRISHARTLDRLEDYSLFLDNARLQLLEVLATLEALDNQSKIALQAAMNNAANAMAQTSDRSHVLFDFIVAVEQFFDQEDRGDHPEMARAHDLLFSNLFVASIINQNTPALNALSEKSVLTEDENLAFYAETLQGIIATDVARLGVAFDREGLQGLLSSSDLLSLLVILNSENLQFYLDAEQLGTIWSHADILGAGFPDAAALQDIVSDKERIMSLGW
jgi:hypothetical protein